MQTCQNRHTSHTQNALTHSKYDTACVPPGHCPEHYFILEPNSLNYFILKLNPLNTEALTTAGWIGVSSGSASSTVSYTPAKASASTGAGQTLGERRREIAALPLGFATRVQTFSPPQSWCFNSIHHLLRVSLFQYTITSTTENYRRLKQCFMLFAMQHWQKQAIMSRNNTILMNFSPFTAIMRNIYHTHPSLAGESYPHQEKNESKI